MVLFISPFLLIIYKKGGITIKKIISIFFLICCFGLFTSFIHAKTNNNTVILGGDSIGLQMSTEVQIVGTYEVDIGETKVMPWKNSDIKEGDVILMIDDYPINNNTDIAHAIKNKESSILKLSRNTEIIYTQITVVKAKSGNYSIGLYVKDKILGVGTLTFIIPSNNQYAALGHGVTNANNEGELFTSTIKSIRKATPGSPGEKNASLNSDEIGSIVKNTKFGIYGKLHNNHNGQEIEIKDASSVKKGKAQILTVVNGNQKEYFDVEIVEVKSQSSANVKGIKIRIIDKRLLELTGGIIQGMSGSPIIQDGYLVGALSHVVISSPSLGYGVFAEWMYNEAKVL